MVYTNWVMREADNSLKRLFFGIEICAPWPEQLPPGRVLSPAHRHITLAFLGSVPYQAVMKHIDRLLQVPFAVGFCGHFDACLALPPGHPRVIAWHAKWYDNSSALLDYQKELVRRLREAGLLTEDREWLPHVTLCRAPCAFSAWEKAFLPLPFFCKAVHLYESTGGLKYEPLKSVRLIQPFEEVEHTADIAFLIRAQNFEGLHAHAFCALCFKFPRLFPYFTAEPKISSIEQVVWALNRAISQADREIGCELKAVCYHGEITSPATGVIQWEMIVDV